MRQTAAEPIAIPIGGGRRVEADLHVPHGAAGLVIFAHGSGSSRFSSRNRSVAAFLHSQGFGTLLLDLLTADEEAVDVYTRQYRFDIERLGERVVLAADWTRMRGELEALPIGLFGASTGAAAALIAAAERPSLVGAVVSRGGRPDLAPADALPRVAAPTLLVVGGADLPVIAMNRRAYAGLRCAKELVIVPGATHLFEEPGALEHVSRLAGEWFERHCLVAHA